MQSYGPPGIEFETNVISLFYNNDNKLFIHSYINIVMIIKKRIGGKMQRCLVILLWNLQKTSTRFFSELTFLTLSYSNRCSSVILCQIPTNHTSF